VRELSPNEAADALMARLSYSASIRAEVATRRCAEKLTVFETVKAAATFSILWFVGNYSYQAALSHTEAGIVNVMSSSSSFFTLLLAACLPSGLSDSFTITKFMAVLASIAGVVSFISFILSYAYLLRVLRIFLESINIMISVFF